MSQDPNSDLSYTNQWTFELIKKHFDRIGSNGFRIKNSKRIQTGPIGFPTVYDDTIAYLCKHFITGDKREDFTAFLESTDIRNHVKDNLFKNWRPNPSPKGQQKWYDTVHIIEVITNFYLSEQDISHLYHIHPNLTTQAKDAKTWLRHAFALRHLTLDEYIEICKAKNLDFQKDPNTFALHVNYYVLPYVQEKLQTYNGNYNIQVYPFRFNHANSQQKDSKTPQIDRDSQFEFERFDDFTNQDQPSDTHTLHSQKTSLKSSIKQKSNSKSPKADAQSAKVNQKNVTFQNDRQKKNDSYVSETPITESLKWKKKESSSENILSENNKYHDQVNKNNSPTPKDKIHTKPPLKSPSTPHPPSKPPFKQPSNNGNVPPPDQNQPKQTQQNINQQNNLNSNNFGVVTSLLNTTLNATQSDQQNNPTNNQTNTQNNVKSIISQGNDQPQASPNKTHNQTKNGKQNINNNNNTTSELNSEFTSEHVHSIYIPPDTRIAQQGNTHPKEQNVKQDNDDSFHTASSPTKNELKQQEKDDKTPKILQYNIDNIIQEQVKVMDNLMYHTVQHKNTPHRPYQWNYNWSIDPPFNYFHVTSDYDKLDSAQYSQAISLYEQVLHLFPSNIQTSANSMPQILAIQAKFTAEYNQLLLYFDPSQPDKTPKIKNYLQAVKQIKDKLDQQEETEITDTERHNLFNIFHVVLAELTAIYLSTSNVMCKYNILLNEMPKKLLPYKIKPQFIENINQNYFQLQSFVHAVIKTRDTMIKHMSNINTIYQSQPSVTSINLDPITIYLSKLTQFRAFRIIPQPTWYDDQKDNAENKEEKEEKQQQTTHNVPQSQRQATKVDNREVLNPNTATLLPSAINQPQRQRTAAQPAPQPDPDNNSQDSDSSHSNHSSQPKSTHTHRPPSRSSSHSNRPPANRAPPPNGHPNHPGRVPFPRMHRPNNNNNNLPRPRLPQRSQFNNLNPNVPPFTSNANPQQNPPPGNNVPPNYPSRIPSHSVHHNHNASRFYYHTQDHHDQQHHGNMGNRGNFGNQNYYQHAHNSYNHRIQHQHQHPSQNTQQRNVPPHYNYSNQQQQQQNPYQHPNQQQNQNQQNNYNPNQGNNNQRNTNPNQNSNPPNGNRNNRNNNNDNNGRNFNNNNTNHINYNQNNYYRPKSPIKNQFDNNTLNFALKAAKASLPYNILNKTAFTGSSVGKTTQSHNAARLFIDQMEYWHNCHKNYVQEQSLLQIAQSLSLKGEAAKRYSRRDTEYPNGPILDIDSFLQWIAFEYEDPAEWSQFMYKLHNWKFDRTTPESRATNFIRPFDQALREWHHKVDIAPWLNNFDRAKYYFDDKTIMRLINQNMPPYIIRDIQNGLIPQPETYKQFKQALKEVQQRKIDTLLNYGDGSPQRTSQLSRPTATVNQIQLDSPNNDNASPIADINAIIPRRSSYSTKPKFNRTNNRNRSNYRRLTRRGNKIYCYRCGRAGHKAEKCSAKFKSVRTYHNNRRNFRKFKSYARRSPKRKYRDRMLYEIDQIYTYWNDKATKKNYKRSKYSKYFYRSKKRNRKRNDKNKYKKKKYNNSRKKKNTKSINEMQETNETDSHNVNDSNNTNESTTESTATSINSTIDTSHSYYTSSLDTSHNTSEDTESSSENTLNYDTSDADEPQQEVTEQLSAMTVMPQDESPHQEIRDSQIHDYLYPSINAIHLVTPPSIPQTAPITPSSSSTSSITATQPLSSSDISMNHNKNTNNKSPTPSKSPTREIKVEPPWIVACQTFQQESNSHSSHLTPVTTPQVVTHTPTTPPTTPIQVTNQESILVFPQQHDQISNQITNDQLQTIPLADRTREQSPDLDDRATASYTSKRRRLTSARCINPNFGLNNNNKQKTSKNVVSVQKQTDNITETSTTSFHLSLVPILDYPRNKLITSREKQYRLAQMDFTAPFQLPNPSPLFQEIDIQQFMSKTFTHDDNQPPPPPLPVELSTHLLSNPEYKHVVHCLLEFKDDTIIFPSNHNPFTTPIYVTKKQIEFYHPVTYFAQQRWYKHYQDQKMYEKTYPSKQTPQANEQEKEKIEIKKEEEQKEIKKQNILQPVNRPTKPPLPHVPKQEPTELPSYQSTETPTLSESSSSTIESPTNPDSSPPQSTSDASLPPPAPPEFPFPRPSVDPLETPDETTRSITLSSDHENVHQYHDNVNRPRRSDL